MNNVPVAWAYIKDGEFWDAIHPDEHEKYEGMYTTPLYTHPHPDNLGLAESIIKQQQAEIEALKAHPVKELNDGGEPVKNATYWKRQYNLMATQNDNLKSGLYHANEQIKYLESHPAKEQDESFDRTASHMAGEYVSYKAELTDEEIMDESFKAGLAISKDTDVFLLEHDAEALVTFARAILRKAQE